MVNDRSQRGAIGRAWRLSRLGMSLTGSYLGYQIQNLFLDPQSREERQTAFRRGATRRLRRELETLKGPAMKLGQILGMQSQWLSPEAVEELAALQAQAPAMHPTLARAQFKASVGRYPEEVFDRFDPVPIAAASLGQVHRATTKRGAEVAVKIQYPAIRTAIENDFKLLRSTSMPGRISGHFPKNLLDEMEAGMLKETDYVNEARNLDWFRERLEPVPYATVPKVFHELSTDRVLTMSSVPGESLHSWVNGRPSRARRDRLGERLMELFTCQVHWLNALHADPHPGNYLIGSDDRIGLVDFGCVKFLSKPMSKLVRCFLDRIWAGGEEGMEVMIRLAWNPKSPSEKARARRVLLASIEFASLIYPDPARGSTVVDFSDPEPLHRMPDIWQMALKNRLTNPEFVFHCRAELGLYNLLHRLQARVDTALLVERVAAMLGALPRH